MRKLTASFFMSLDGVVQAPERWQPPYMTDEIGAVLGQSIGSSGAFLLGRRTYEEWAAFWPTQDPAQNPMAAAINGMPKYVASRTLADVEWQNSTVLKGDLATEVSALKDQPGGDILISGSATLVRSLLEAGLIDELSVLVHPVLVGSGARLFEAPAAKPLELVASHAFGNGVLNLSYRPS
jgi:dihydrofolate reductase